MTSCQASDERARIERHFAAKIAAADEQLMRAHVVDCADCRAYYERHLLLAEIDPSVPPARDRMARGLGLSPQRQPSLWPVYAGAMLAACVLALLVVAPWKKGDGAGDEFAARGAALKPEPAEIVVYRQARGGAAERVERKIRREDELLFAYRNDKGFAYLLVFGVDENGEVFWYYPAWTDPNAVPSSVSIRKDAALVELPDAVSHELKGRTLRLFAVFSDTSHSVREIEERLKSLGSARTGPLFPGTLERELPLEVE